MAEAMRALVALVSVALHRFVPVSAFNIDRHAVKAPESNRREALQRVGLGILGTAGVASSILPQPSSAAADEELIDVYFGCGCFWHVQHEFVVAEQKILGRSDEELTARAGYAGGRAKDDLVCYHNARGIGDYGTLGHAEVVALSIPPSSFQAFAEEYFKLFDDKGNRPDQFGDRGPEYRNLVGVPGGAKGPYAKQLVSASVAQGDKLDFAIGKGDDRDARAVSFVMDPSEFPFHIAEQYHQFHDGFNLNENYPNSYNSLASKLAEKGKLEKSMCPNGWVGVGLGGL